MNEFITSLTEKAGITADQASKVVDHIKDYVKEKFPMMSGAVDNLFGEAPAAAASAVADPAAPVAAAAPESSVMDKISDVIPGETGQKVEDL